MLLSLEIQQKVMIREALQKYSSNSNKEFRYRGIEPGRLENFSDAVIALAITLLLISTSAPTNFEQIKRFVWEIIPFCLCITLIVLIWFQHFTFFYRYGLRSGKVIVLNTIFLIIVLFYVYPMKFLTKLILIPIAKLSGNDEIFQELSGMIRMQDMPQLMIVYGLGASSVFLILMLMYRYAYTQAEELELSEIEKFDTKVSMNTNLLMAVIPLLSVLAAMVIPTIGVAGFVSGNIYFLYPILMGIYGKTVKKKRKQLLAMSDADQTEMLSLEVEKIEGANS